MTDTASIVRAGRADLQTGRPSLKAWAWSAAPITLIFMAHVWYGANSSFAALTLTALEALMFLAFLGRPKAGRSLAQVKSLPVLLVLFGLVLLAALASLAHRTLGGGYPVWSYVAAAPAAVVDRAATLIEIVKLLGLAAMFGVGLLLGLDDRLSETTRLLIRWGGAVFCIWMLLLFVGDQQDTHGRLMGAFGSANSTATVLGLLILLNLPAIVRPGGAARASRIEQIFQRAPAVGLLLLLLGSFLLTGSRWGSVSLVVAVLVFLAAQLATGRMKARTALLFAAILIVGAAGLLLFKGDILVSRMAAAAPTRGDPRQAIFAVHGANFLRSPLFGYGLGSFAEVNQLALDSRNFLDLSFVRDLHNVYMQWLEEAGIVGAVPMFALVAWTIGATLWTRGKRRNLTWSNALIAADVMVLAHGLGDFALQVPSIAAFWALLLGLQLGLASGSATKRGSRTRAEPTGIQTASSQ